MGRPWKQSPTWVIRKQTPCRRRGWIPQWQRLEVLDQGVGRAESSRGREGESVPCFLPASGGGQHCLAYGQVTPISGFVFTWPSACVSVWVSSVS